MLHFLERRDLCDLLADGESLSDYAVRLATQNSRPCTLNPKSYTLRSKLQT